MGLAGSGMEDETATERPPDDETLAALRASERRYRAISAYTYDWESWHSPDGRALWINNAVERITGHSVQECLAMRDYPLPIVRECDRGRIAEVLQSAAAGVPGNDVEFCVKTRDGGERWVAISWQSIADDDGSNMGFRTSIRDIADRKRLEQQIREYTENLEQLVQDRTRRLLELEAHRAKVDRLAALGQLAAGVAHEINNPLAGIQSSMELIRESVAHDHDARQMIDLVQSEIDRMAGIIRQLYQLHRPQTATGTKVDLTRVCAQTVQLLAGPCRRRGVTISVETDGGSPISARLPEGELKQVLYNMLLNAAQASPPGGHVDVSVSDSEGDVVLQITDHGEGIAADVLPLIFDPFFTTKHGQVDAGMGLGLSVSQSLVLAMGGRIDVESASGCGSTFRIRLPSAGLDRRDGSLACPPGNNDPDGST